MPKKLLFFFLIFPIVVFSQNDTIIKGKVVSESSLLEGIHVVNLSSRQGVVTDSRGYFQIKAKISDTLQFSAVNLKARRYSISEDDFKQNLILVKMQSLINELDEATIIHYKNINAVALGIVPANQKSYTPAERKLKTANDVNGQYGTNTQIGLDPLLNWISGRTKMLKSEVAVESKEQLQLKTSDYFKRTYFVETLKIPEIYIEGFLFYIVENERYVRAMKDRNKTMATFILSELATEYLKLQEIQTEKPAEDEK